MKRYFLFSDGSIAHLVDEHWWSFRPIKVYTSYMLGFGEWIDY
jgi:hypothetical protein